MVTLQNSQSAEHPTESRSYEPASTERRPGSLCGRAGHKAYLTQITPIEYTTNVSTHSFREMPQADHTEAVRIFFASATSSHTEW